MKLSDFLAAGQISHAAFAKQIGVSQAAVTRYAQGRRLPRPGILRKIHHATAGAVTYGDFVSGEPTDLDTPARVSSTPPQPSDAAPPVSEGDPSPRPSPTRGEGEECEVTA